MLEERDKFKIRVSKDHYENVRSLAGANGRTMKAETAIAIEAHLAAHRALLKKGPKVSP